MAGHVGQHLGDVAHPHRAAQALQLARHVEQAAEIAGQQRVGAGRGDIGRFVAHHAFDISGYLTQNVPPKPQQTSGVAISLSRSPSTDPSRRRGCSLTPSSRRPEQES